MKRGVLAFLSLFLINFVSAQFGYGGFSLTDFLNSSDAILLALFFIIAALVSLVLGKSSIFKDHYGKPNRGIVAVISFSVSLLAIYGIYRSGFNLEGLFSGFGFSSDVIYPLIWIVLIAAAIFIIWKMGLGVFLLALGLLIMIVSIFTDLIYEKTTAFFIGLILMIVGLLVWKKTRKWWGKNVRTI